MPSGEIGGWIGSAVGILGGVFGTWIAIHNTSGRLERAFVIRMAAVAWVSVLLFLAGFLLLPRPYDVLLWIPYSVVMVAILVWATRRHAKLRSRENLPG